MKVQTRSLRVLVMLALWACSGSPLAVAQTTALYLESQPGDFIGQGETHTWTQADYTFQAVGEYRAVSIFAESSSATNFWSLSFGAPEPGLLPGTYENATRYGAWPATPQLSVGGQSRGCNTLTGRFVVYELTFNGAGAVTRFAADFEQHCDGRPPALFGAIRFNSTRASLVPFDDVVPEYSLTVEPATNGYVTGAGIDCGAGRSDCRELYSLNTVVSLRAVPADGYIFLGWSGDCVGEQDASVTVSWQHVCAPVFNRASGSGGVESPDFSQGALFLDGVLRSIDGTLPLTRRARQVYASWGPGSPLTSVVEPTRFVPQFRGRVQFAIEGPHGMRATVLFAAPPGAHLVSGSDYTYATAAVNGAGSAPVLLLHQSVNNLSCGSGGRFRVHEYTLNESTATVISFAADFEVPCGPDGIITGSIRYRAARSSLQPFDGIYPLHALRVSPTLGGYVTSAGILCGDGGRTDCDETYPLPALIALQSVASPGYQFVAWTGGCLQGHSTTALSVQGMTQCFAVFAPAPGGGAPGDPSLAEAALLIDRLGLTSVPDRAVWVGANALIQDWGTDSLVSVSFSSGSSGATGTILLSAAGGLAGPRDYGRGSAAAGAISLAGCSVVDARFRIYEFALEAGRVATLAADFEALCYPNERVVGAVRINSTRAGIVPFDGDFPTFRLTIEPAINGIVTGSGIDCGPGRVDCTEKFSTPTTVVLQAMPVAGYRFVGWSGDCEGASTATLAVDWIGTCTAVFNAVIPGRGAEDPRLSAGSVFIDSQSGDPVGQGRRFVWFDANMIPAAAERRWVTVTARRPYGEDWSIDLLAPAGQELRPGTYENAGDVFGPPDRPGLRVASRSWSCSSSAARRFVVHEISFAAGSSSLVTSLAADFEQRCTAGGPALKGTIRYQSGRSVLKPFAPSVFTPVGTPVRPDVNRDGWADLVWRHSTSGRNAVWLLNNLTASMTMGLEPSSAATVADLAWEIRAVGDMNGDGSPDLVWQHSTSGRMAVWFMSGSRLVTSNYISTAAHSSTEPDLNWKIVAAGDMDRDGHVDLLWRHRTSGQLRLWHMDGIVQWDSVSLGTVADVNWEIAGLADMNGDGMLDLVWRHYGHGGIATWFMYDALVQATVRLSDLADTTWRIAGVADMNGDGKSDLVWQNTSSGGIAVWLMDGVSTIGGRYLNPGKVSDPNWRIVGVR